MGFLRDKLNIGKYWKFLIFAKALFRAYIVGENVYLASALYR